MILFVDDEKRIIDSYKMELEMVGYTISLQNDVDAALKVFETDPNAIDLLILDIMMPSGVSFKDEATNGGLRTGIRFYERVRSLAPSLPIIVFTNVSDKKVAERFSQESNCLFLRKEVYLPFEFAEEVKKIVPLPLTQE